jgi:hypothetical protein
MYQDIETNGVPQNQMDTDVHRIFLWDNLNSHFAPIVNQTIYAKWEHDLSLNTTSTVSAEVWTN